MVHNQRELRRCGERHITRKAIEEPSGIDLWLCQSRCFGNRTSCFSNRGGFDKNERLAGDECLIGCHPPQCQGQVVRDEQRLQGDLKSAEKFIRSTRFFALAESLGGVESLICHPATMTHSLIPREERLKAGFKDELIRISVGVENFEDLIADLENAFKKI